MPVIEYDVYKQKLAALGPQLEELAAALDLDGARREVEELEEKSSDANFWNDLAASQKVLQRTKHLKNKLEQHERLVSQWEDLTTLVEMAAEEDDASLLPEVEEGYGKLESSLEEAKLATLLTGEYDANNAILTLHAGAGGTEAQDWCQMLFRMYTRWAERHAFTWQTLDYEPCDAAGISPPPSPSRGRTPTASSRARTASTVWSASHPLTPTPGGRPPSPRWRLCRRSTTTTPWRSVPRTSRCRSSAPPAPEAST